MADEAIVLSMLLRLDPDTGRWEKVWPKAAPMLSNVGTPSSEPACAVSVPRDPPARIGDRLIAGEEASELVHQCEPIELPSIQFVERVCRQRGCDDSNRDRIDAYEVWLVQPVVPGETPEMAGDDRVPDPVVMSAPAASVRTPVDRPWSPRRSGGTVLPPAALADLRAAAARSPALPRGPRPGRPARPT